MATLEMQPDTDTDDDSDDSSTSTGASASSQTRTTSTSSNSDDASEMNTGDDEPTIAADTDDAGMEELKTGPFKKEGSTWTPELHRSQLLHKTKSTAALPKARIKLSLRLPTKANKDKSAILKKENNCDDVQTATVVPTDDDDEAVAEAVPFSVTSSLIPSYTSAPAKPPKKKIKPVRVPPMSSPGLMLPHASGLFRGETDTNGFSSPASVFDHCMTLAGYTVEERTENPHRGSSVKRVVGDMFDSDVKLTQSFPKLVPTELMNYKGDIENDNQNETPTLGFPLVYLLVQALTSNTAKFNHEVETCLARKRKRPWSFQEMIPLSLTIQYPESYLKERLAYVNAIEAREAAIVANQETVLDTEKIKEKYNEEVARKSVADMPAPPALPKSNDVPPIPEPPAPPKLADLAKKLNWQVDEMKYPLCPPRNNPEFVAHLDPNCFHITEGRYFGLLTNRVPDPHFLGPSAPGIMGLTVSAGTSLATSYVGHQSAGSASLASTVYGTSSTQPLSNVPSASDVATMVELSVAEPKTKSDVSSAPRIIFNKKPSGPAPTSSSTELKKLMESTGAAREAMRVCIVRAAVHASRTGRHGQSFVGSNGHIYPDVARAFAAWGDMKPCERCKNNKQGAYHCRLRRKHKELDHDGGNSPVLLAPLFLEPLEDLIHR